MGEDNIAKQGKDFHPQKTRPKSSMIIKGGPSREREVKKFGHVT